MNNAKVTGLRGVELGVKDLSQSIAFYQCIWGLDPVVAEGDTVYLRANGSEHHVVTLRERYEDLVHLEVVDPDWRTA